VRGDEELGHGHAFTEAAVNRNLDDGRLVFLAGFGLGRTRHQSAHAGQLGEVVLVAAGAGYRHHVDRVHTRQGFHQLVADGGLDPFPEFREGAFPFLRGKQAAVAQPVQLVRLLLALVHVVPLVRGDVDVAQRNGHAGDGRIQIAHVLQAVQNVAGAVGLVAVEHFGDQQSQVLLLEFRSDLAGCDLLLDVGAQRYEIIVRGVLQGLRIHHVQVREIRREHFVEDDLADAGQQVARVLLLTEAGLVQRISRDGDAGVQMHDLHLIGHQDLVDVLEDMAFIVAEPLPHVRLIIQAELAQTVRMVIELLGGLFHVQIEVAQHQVLARGDDRFAVFRTQDVVGTQHQDLGLGSGLFGQRQMDCHLVAVKVGVEGRADQRMDTDGASLDQLREEALDAQTVQSRCTVQENRMVRDDFLDNVPDSGILAFDQLFSGLRVGCDLLVDEFIDDKRLGQLDRHLLREAALPHLPGRSDRNDRTA